MKLQYDPQIDAIRIVLQPNKKVLESESLATNPDIIFDYADDNSAVAIEILNLKKNCGGDDDYLKGLDLPTGD